MVGVTEASEMKAEDLLWEQPEEEAEEEEIY